MALLDRGALIEPRTKALLAPLHFAATRGNLSIVRALLDWGANVNVEDDVRLGVVCF